MHLGIFDLPPRSTQDTAANPHWIHELAVLEDSFTCMVAEQRNYQQLEPLQEFGVLLSLSLPNINAYSEQLKFIVERLDARVVLADDRDCPATSRALGMDLYLDLLEMCKQVCPDSDHMLAFRGRNDRFAVASLMSFKQVRLTGKPNIFGICFATNSERAELLRQALHHVVVELGIELSVGGGILPLRIYGVPPTNIRDKMYDATIKISKDMLGSKKIKFTKDVRLGQGAIHLPETLRIIANSWGECRGIVAILRNGRSNPTFLVIHSLCSNMGLYANAKSITDTIIAKNPTIDLAPAPLPGDFHLPSTNQQQLSRHS